MLVFSLLSPLIFLLVFLIGLIVGSFLNVVILRGEKGERLGGRSRCDACGKKLQPRELIPIISFMIQKARCRACGAVLSWQYPLVEAACAVLFVILTWWFLANTSTGYGLLMALVAFPVVAAFIVLVVSDLRFQILPDGAVAVLFLFGVFIAIGRGTLVSDAMTAVAIALFLGALWFFSDGTWMGLGDAKLVLATSLVIGFPESVLAFLLAFWLGGIWGATLLLSGKKHLSSRIPFGPFILAGALLAYFFSQQFLGSIGLSTIW